MAKKKAQPTHIKTPASNTIVLSMRNIEKKIRKTQPPVSRIHKAKVKYNRKNKHPFKED
ncbi:MAG: hypothetical protein WCW31_02300 [Patescibacteria group bacterium]|jgi:hypothetical protein